MGTKGTKGTQEGQGSLTQKQRQVHTVISV